MQVFNVHIFCAFVFITFLLSILHTQCSNSTYFSVETNGEKVSLPICPIFDKEVKVDNFAYCVVFRIWLIVRFLWIWWWRLLRNRSQGNLSSWLLKTWGKDSSLSWIHLLSLQVQYLRVRTFNRWRMKPSQVAHQSELKINQIMPNFTGNQFVFYFQKKYPRWIYFFWK